MQKRFLLPFFFAIFIIGCTQSKKEETPPSFYSEKFQEAVNFLDSQSAHSVFSLPNRLDYLNWSKKWTFNEVNTWFLGNSSLPEPNPEFILADLNVISSLDPSIIEDFVMVFFSFMGMQKQDVFLFNSQKGLLELYNLGNSSIAVLKSGEELFYFKCLIFKEADQKTVIKPTYSGDANFVDGCIFFEGNLAVWASEKALNSNLFKSLFFAELPGAELVFNNGDVKVYQVSGEE